MRKVKSFRNFQIWDIQTWIKERKVNPDDPKGILRISVLGHIYQRSNSLNWMKFKEHNYNCSDAFCDYTQFDWSSLPDHHFRREVTWYSGEILIIEFELFD